MTLDAALEYAARGWLVFPTHSVSEARCSCGSVACNAPGKHPRTANGVHAASTDPSQLASWWQRWPDASVALACGPVSGVLVLDVDPRHGGDDSIEALELRRPDGPLPRTLTSMTGGGGRHLFFKWPADVRGELRNRVGWLPGVDVRGHGAYVLLPPSTHLSGQRYQWEEGGEDEIAELPEDVLELLLTGAGEKRMERGGGSLPSTGSILDGVDEGERDQVLFRACCRWRRQLRDRKAVEVLALEAARNCRPPFPEEDALRKVEQAFKQPDQDTPLKLVQLEVKKQDEDRGEPGARHLSDDGNALRLVDRHSDELRYAPGIGWLVWDGARWRPDELGEVMELARRTALSIYDEARAATDSDVKLATARWALKSEQARSLTAMVQLAKTDREVAVRVEELDQHPWLLNTAQGAVDLRTGKVMPCDQDLLLTRVCGAPVVSDAACPRWLSFLEKVLPDSDVRQYVQRAVGYSLTGLTREKVFFICEGSGDNGKSVFMEVLTRVLGDYAVTTPASTITQQRMGSGVPNDIARLRGARFVPVAETAEGDRLAAELIKRLTGGDTVTARFMRQEFFEFTPQLKLWLATNHPPVVSDFGEALWSRIRLVPFHVRIPKAEQVPRDELEGSLLEEGPGILRWAIEGAVAWSEAGLGEAASVVAATEAYRVDQDWFGEFLEECCEAGGDGTTTELYQVFESWCLTAGQRPWSKQAFTRQLTQRGYTAMRLSGGKRAWRGIQAKRVVGRYGI